MEEHLERETMAWATWWVMDKRCVLAVNNSLGQKPGLLGVGVMPLPLGCSLSISATYMEQQTLSPVLITELVRPRKPNLVQNEEK